MADFYIRQSLHVATLAELTASVGISAGFIAMVDSHPGRRYTAVLAGTFDIDGDHVVAGQDGTQWTDDANGDLAGSFARPKVVGIEEAQIKGRAYSTNSIPFGQATWGIVSDGYNLWISSGSYPVIHKVDQNNWEAPLATINLETNPSNLFVSGNYILCTAVYGANGMIFIIDWTTNTQVGYIYTDGPSNFACVDGYDKLWVASTTGVAHFDLSTILTAYPSPGGLGVNVVLPGGSALYGTFGNGFVWATHDDNTLTRIDPDTDDVTVYTLSEMTRNVIPLCTDGYIWISNTDTDVLRYDANSPGTEPTIITLLGNYTLWMAVDNGILYVADNDYGANKIHSIDIVTGTYIASSEGNDPEDWANQITVLGTNVWTAVSEINTGYSSVSIPIGDTLNVSHTEFPGVTVSGIDLNKNPFPAVVKTGDVLAAVPGSGSPSKIIPVDASTFFVMRQSSIVHIHSVSAPGDYTSTPIPLNNAGKTLDLNLVQSIDAAYDGYRFLWVIGSNGASSPVYYLWKIDSTLALPVVSYVFSPSLPVTISSIQALACAGKFVIVSILSGNDDVYRGIKVDAATGSIIDELVFDQTYGITGFIPVTATNNGDFAWVGGNFTDDGNGTYCLSARINPSLTVHKDNDITNIIAAPAASDLESLNVLLNDLKVKINSHLLQPRAHLIADGQNTIIASNAIDIASPYTTATALANEIRSLFGAHTSQFLNVNVPGMQQAGVHYYLDNTNRITDGYVIDNTDLAGLISLANNIRSAYEGHRVQVRQLIHNKSDRDYLTTSIPITSFADAQTVLNQTKLVYNYHLSSYGVHVIEDAVNIVLDADATDTDPAWLTAAALANDIKAMLNAHLTQTGVHAADDLVNFISVPDAVSTDLLSVITLANALASDTTLGAYNRHRTEASVHSVDDTTNIESLAAVPLLINSNTLTDVQLLLNDLVTVYTAHIASTTYHAIADAVNVITAPSATDTAPTAPTAYTLAVALKAAFNNHLVAAGVHISDDTTSTILGPNPIDNTDISGIMNVAYAFGDGYLSTSGEGYEGAYNFHLLQNSEFVYSGYSRDESTAITIETYVRNGQTLVLLGKNFTDTTPEFEIISGQIGPDPTEPPGTHLFSLLTDALPTPPHYLRSMAIDVANNTFWFLAGGLPDENSNPYTLNRVPDIFGEPDPTVDLIVPVPLNLGPADIASHGEQPIRVAYRFADYIGDVGVDGTLDVSTQYPMGGALQFVSASSLVSGGGSGGTEPLSNIRYVDGATITIPHTGSSSAPYSSLQEAFVEAGSISYPGATLLITPGDYSSDPLTWISPGNPPSGISLNGISLMVGVPDIYARTGPLYLDNISASAIVGNSVALNNTNIQVITADYITANNSTLTDIYVESSLSIKQSKVDGTIYAGTLWSYNTDDTVNTVGQDTLRIRSSATDPYTSIIVTSDTALSKIQLVSELNSSLSGMSLIAILDTYNRIKFYTSTGYVEVADSGSTINSVLILGSGYNYPCNVIMDSSSWYSFKRYNGTYTGDIQFTEPPPEITILNDILVYAPINVPDGYMTTDISTPPITPAVLTLRCVTGSQVLLQLTPFTYRDPQASENIGLLLSYTWQYSLNGSTWFDIGLAAVYGSDDYTKLITVQLNRSYVHAGAAATVYFRVAVNQVFGLSGLELDPEVGLPSMIASRL